MPKDVKSGLATKSDTRTMKADAAERDKTYQDAYETGLEEGRIANGTGSRSGGRSAKLSFSNDAQTVILITMTITGLVSIIENVHTADKTKTTPVIRIIVGTFVAGGLLLAASYAVPEFASGLSIVAMLATLFDRGTPFWESIIQVTGNPQVQNNLLPMTPPATPVPVQPKYGTASYNPTTNPPLST